jgi:hypothetical protein
MALTFSSVCTFELIGTLRAKVDRSQFGQLARLWT